MKAPAQSRAIPCEIRFLLAISGCLLLRLLRRDWKREWLTEFSHVFPEAAAHPPTAALRRRMFTRAARAVPHGCRVDWNEGALHF
jgi:hypothetical protein